MIDSDGPDDEDYIDPGQESQQRPRPNQRPQNQGASTSQGSRSNGSSSQRPQNQGASTSQGSQGDGSSRQRSHNSGDREKQLESIQEGIKFLKKNLNNLKRAESGKVNSGDEKKDKPKPKEEYKCLQCGRQLANQTNLFRHYRAIHQEPNPERLLGYTFNETIVNLDDSQAQERRCGICGFVARDKSALDTHVLQVHSRDLSCSACGYKASSRDDLDKHSRKHGVDNASAGNDNADASVNPRVVETVKDKMYKCEECSCYFEERSFFDEHVKAMHVHEVLCKICNKNFRFKDIEGHMRDTHPDVYKEKEEADKANAFEVKNVRSKSGKTKTAFKCKTCKALFSSKEELRRHTRGHRKEARRRATSHSQTGNRQNRDSIEDSPAVNIIFICEACNIATGSYDVVVEHSQKHLADPNEVFSTNYCDICELKFEPVCYEKHVDEHYKSENMTKESFKYFAYQHNQLLRREWFLFNMADEAVTKIVSQSIYAHTRSIKMRARGVSGTTSVNLYQCMQCKDYVDPSMVTNHALNFDTCLKINNSKTCNVCDRSFNCPVARDNHEPAHSGSESFRVVMFNNERDREFNYVLNNPNAESRSFKNQGDKVTKNNDNAEEKVIYKCLCGLCFVSKESADDHIQVCPGNERKATCHKCDYMFNIHELIVHNYEHHLNDNTLLIVKDIVPDAIMVDDSDEKSGNEDSVKEIVDLSTDDEDNKNESDKAKDAPNTGVDLEQNKDNELSQTVTATPAEALNPEQNQTEDVLIATDTPTSNDEPMDEDNEDEADEPISDPNLETNEDDSQNTIVSNDNETTIVNLRDVANRNSEIKCVETDRLLNPYVRSRLKSTDAREINKTLATEIETARLEIDRVIKEEIKEEIPSYVDEDGIHWRAPARLNELSNVTSTGDLVDLDDILTDDEDEEMPVYSEDEVMLLANDEANSINIHPTSLLSITDGTVNANNDAFRVNVLNGNVSNSIATNHLNEKRGKINFYKEETVDLYEPNETNGVSVGVNNRNSRETDVLSENQIVNTDSIKSEDEKIQAKLMTQLEPYIRIRYDDIKIEEPKSEPNDGYSTALVPFRNNENHQVVNNLEVQFSGQEMLTQPSCYMF